MAAPIETVFLDAGGVLVFPNWTRISGALARHGVLVDADRLAAAEPFAKRELDRPGGMAPATDDERGWAYFSLVLRHAGVRLSAATDAALQELRAYHDERNLWESVPDDVAPALERLCAMGLRLAVVSNANGTIGAHFARLGLTPHFACVLDSAVEGVEKPDPRFFEIALQRAGGRRDTTVHVGDLYTVDVVGARAAGIRPVLVDAAGLYPDADCPRVGSVTELAVALERGALY